MHRLAPLALLLLIACPPTGDDDDSAVDPPAAGFVLGAPSPGSSTGEELAAMPDGGVVVIGAFAETMTFDSGGPNETALTSAGAFDVFLARYDANGALLWATRAGSDGGDWGFGVSTDSSGNVWATGRFSGEATFGDGAAAVTLTAVENSDFWVAKYDPDGGLQSVSMAGGNNDQVGTAVAAADDGGAYAVGYLQGNITFAAGEANEEVYLALGAQDTFLVKYAADGTFEWMETIHGGATELPYDVAVAANGDVLVTGEFNTNIVFGQGQANERTLTSNAGNLDGFLARYDSAGQVQWALNEGVGLPDQGRAVAMDGDEVLQVGYFRGGGTYGAGTLNVQAGGFDDGFIARYDAAGTMGTWRQGGGSALQGSTIPYDVAVDASGDAVMVGQFTNTTTFGSETTPVGLMQSGQGDIFIALYAADGTFRWAGGGGGPNSDSAQSVVINDDAVWVTGWFGGDITLTVGTTTVSATAVGGSEFFLLKSPMP